MKITHGNLKRVAWCAFYLTICGMVFSALQVIPQIPMETVEAPNWSPVTWPIAVTSQGADDGIELSLTYNKETSNSTVPQYTIPDHLVLAEGAKNVRLAFEDLVKIPDEQWHPSFSQQAYLTYPQGVDLVDTVNRLMLGKNIRVVSKQYSFVTNLHYKTVNATPF